MSFGTLISGVLIVISVLFLTSIIMASAPWIAGAIVVLGLVWLYAATSKDDESTPGT